ncbi:hypothetical protein A2U01_0052404, partial [Trifolium medium]|nr:hypothetical protein [Trifolium medium]
MDDGEVKRIKAADLKKPRDNDDLQKDSSVRDNDVLQNNDGGDKDDGELRMAVVDCESGSSLLTFVKE